jgi:aspartate racemase
VPPAETRAELNRIIFDELVKGIFRPESVAVFLRTIEALQAEGCDAVVLGCTEIPRIVNDQNSPLPVLDSTRLLARAALRRSTEG